LIPRYAGGRPSKLTKEQKDKLLELLKQKDNWTTEEVRDLIHKEFNVEYTLKQIRIILKKYGMKCAKLYTYDYRRPSDAEGILKKLPQIEDDVIIGFIDEASPQTTSNSQRFWSFCKSKIFKNTDKYKANAFGSIHLMDRL